MTRTALARLALLMAMATAWAAPPVTAQEMHLSTRAAAFDDRDPVDFGRHAPHRLPVHGIDVSRFQGDIDWHAAAHAGVNFAFIKATEGGDLLDAEFTRNWHAAARAGVLRGAYHFYYFCTDARTQARWFIRNVPRGAGALPPVLDMEWNPHSPTCQKRPAPAVVRREMNVFLNRLERHYGQRPIVYTTPQFYRENDLGRVRAEFWLRSVAKPLAEVYPGQHWHFWQYSGTGIVRGIGGDVDLNAFGGTRTQWAKWVAQRRQ